MKASSMIVPLSEMEEVLRQLVSRNVRFNRDLGFPDLPELTRAIQYLEMLDVLREMEETLPSLDNCAS